MDVTSSYDSDGYYPNNGRYNALHLFHFSTEMVGAVCHRTIYLCHSNAQLSG